MSVRTLDLYRYVYFVILRFKHKYIFLIDLYAINVRNLYRCERTDVDKFLLALNAVSVAIGRLHREQRARNIQV